MNASRRAYSALAQALNRAGFASLMFDFYATGDSEGEFETADWATWQNDLRSVLAFARNHLSYLRIQLFGLRAAALHIADLVADQVVAQDIDQCVFWQPVLDGAEHLDQFLRLRLAANLMLDQKDAVTRETTHSLRNLAQSEGNVEVAGYALSAKLMAEMQQRRLEFSSQSVATNSTLHWFEIATPPTANPKRTAVIETLRKSGITLFVYSATAKRFWSLVDAPLPLQLIEHTVACMRGKE